ncbi:MAG: magnesium transporter [Deltaproteobacteria bacterium]|jgi:magnesium transporter|nr:magnesium transporter [Deltaproteobacteria bacterium]
MTASTILAIKPLLEEGKEEELKGVLSSLHPADLAEVLAPLDMEDTIKVMSLMDIQKAADVLVELTETTRDEVARTLPVEQLSLLVDEMDTDDAADIVAELSDDTAIKVLSSMDTEDSQDVRRLLMYGPETAGGLMQTELIKAMDSDTVADVVSRIREKSDEVGDIGSIFVVDKIGTFQGQVSLKDLLLAYPQDTIESLLTKSPALVLRVDEDQESVAQKFQKYDVKTAPVVDSHNRLLGKVTVDDIMDVVNEEADKDFYRMAGSSEEELYTIGTLKTAGLRLPWLLFNLGGGLVTSFILAHFEKSFQAAMALVAFVPMVMGLAGAVGSQSATITVRGIATGRVQKGQLWRNIIKEQKVSLLLALIFGLFITLVASYLYGDNLARIGIAIGVSLTCAILVAALLGFLTPNFFRAINIDPALASGPVVTSMGDVVSLFIYATVGTTIV